MENNRYESVWDALIENKEESEDNVKNSIKIFQIMVDIVFCSCRMSDMERQNA